MMNRWPFNRAETLALVAVVIALVALIPPWVDLLGKLGVDLARLVPYVESLQRARWVIVAFIVCALGVFLVRRFREPLALWGRERYVRLLVRLSGRVREDLAEILCAEVGREEDRPEEGWGFSLTFTGHANSTVVMLELILSEYVEKGGPSVVIASDHIRSNTWWRGTEDDLVRAGAKECKTLREHEFLEDWELHVSRLELEVWLPPEMKVSGAAEASLDKVRAELFMRQVPIRS